MEYKSFYENQLYPLQNKVLCLAEQALEKQFYLTGGTALSRCYFHHRYSDDLDFFSLMELPALEKYAHRFRDVLKSEGMTISCDRLSSTFCSFFCKENGVDLKIDLVNDVVARCGDISKTPIFNQVDNVNNILSNKITAITRYEPKDVADIWIIACHRSFLWRDLLDDAGKKAGIDPLMVAHILKTAPSEVLSTVKWRGDVDMNALQSDLSRIAEDVLLGRANSLCPRA
jgi:hypothetical protein